MQCPEVFLAIIDWYKTNSYKLKQILLDFYGTRDDSLWNKPTVVGRVRFLPRSP